MAFRDARGFSTGLCREAVLHRCSLVSSNTVCERSTRCVRLPGAHARHRSRIARPHCAGPCCIAQPHGQRRTAVTAKRMTSPYVQNASSAGDEGRARGGEWRGGGGVESIDLSMIHHVGRGGGGGVKTLVHQSLVPSKLSSQSLCFAKQTQGSPYQATFRENARNSRLFGLPNNLQSHRHQVLNEKYWILHDLTVGRHHVDQQDGPLCFTPTV